RSDPQMAELVIFTTASRAFRIFGSGTVSTRTSCVPYQHAAFMIASSNCGVTRRIARGERLFGRVMHFLLFFPGGMMDGSVLAPRRLAFCGQDFPSFQ